MDVCKIDFNVNDDLSSVGAFLERLQHAFRREPIHQVQIDLERCQYLGPDAVACLAAVIAEQKHVGRRIRVQWPRGPRRLLEYCTYSGLRNLLESGEVLAVPWNPAHNVLPLQQFKKASFRDADPVIALIQRETSLSDDLQEYLRICVNEVVQNIQDHAASVVGGFLSARYMAGAQEVRVAIVDRGKGIRSTLSTRYADTDDSNCLRRVLEGQYTAQSRINNAGLGLSNLRAIVSQLNGRLAIVAERSSAQVVPRQPLRYNTMPFRFGGTAVFFTLPTSQLGQGVVTIGRD